VKIKNFKIAGAKFKDLLTEKIQENLLKCLGAGVKLQQLSNTIGLLRFVGELHMENVLNSDFVNLCLELIAEDGSDDAADCLKALLKVVGGKVERGNSKKLDETFERFKEIAEGEESYRAVVLKELVGMRANEWTHEYDEADIEETLTNFTESDWESVRVLLTSPEDVQKLVEITWKLILTAENHEQLAKLCIEMSNNSEEFQAKLLDFLLRRNVSFQSIKKSQFTDKIRHRLDKVLSFTSTLFTENCLSDDDFQPWLALKLLRQLPPTSIPNLISKIEERVSQSENPHLKASMMILEGVEHERSMENLLELKMSIVEVTKVVRKLQRNPNEESAFETKLIELV
jgi:hypothetical protein